MKKGCGFGTWIGSTKQEFSRNGRYWKSFGKVGLFLQV